MLIKDVLLQKYVTFTAKHKTMLSSGAAGIFGFLLAIFTNTISDPNIKTFDIVWSRMFDIQERSINLLNWLMLLAFVIGILFLFILPKITRSWIKRQSYDYLLTATLRKLRSKNPIETGLGVIVVDWVAELRVHPEITIGWIASEVNVLYSTQRFTLPLEYRDAYKNFERFFKEKQRANGESRIGLNDNTVMLTSLPNVSSDQPILTLSTKTNSYIYSQFYWNHIVTNHDKCNQLLGNLLNNSNTLYPHNLCLHLVVITADDKVLLTLRSNNVGSDPNTWSCSIEENFKPDDINAKGAPTKLAVERWMKRALLEELGVRESMYSVENLRILSVFLETNRMNISLSGIVKLDIDHQELTETIRINPHSDHEYPLGLEINYLSFRELAMELRQNQVGRNYHPTSRYRMLMTLLHIYGIPEFAMRFAHLINERQSS